MIKLIYIAGSGRSGSTLLERMMGQIPAFTTIGELRHLWRSDYETTVCGCGQPFKECPFWQPILADVLGDESAIDFPAMLKLRNQADRTRFLPYMLTGWHPASFKEPYATYTDLLRQIYEQIQARNPDRVIVDSSKDISTLYLLAKQPWAELHVVHLIRDSRAVAYSVQRKRKLPQFKDRTAYQSVQSASKAARDWISRNTFAEGGKRLYHSYVQLRYEDMIEQPAQFIKEIATSAEVGRADSQGLDDEVHGLVRPDLSASLEARGRAARRGLLDRDPVRA